MIYRNRSDDEKQKNKAIVQNEIFISFSYDYGSKSCRLNI